MSRAPRSLFIGPVRRWATRSALTLLLLLLVGLWYVTNPKRISRLSEVLLSRVLGGNVKVQTGHLSLSGTLILQGIEVRTPESADATVDAAVPIFTAEQIEARFDWLSLFSGQLNATQLVAIAPVFEPIENRDSGHWNYELLRPGFGGSSSAPSSKKGLSLPVVVLRDARVKWGEIRQGKLQQTAETVIDGELTPDPRQDATYRFEFNQYAVPGPPPGGGGGGRRASCRACPAFPSAAPGTPSPAPSTSPPTMWSCPTRSATACLPWPGIGARNIIWPAASRS